MKKGLNDVCYSLGKAVTQLSVDDPATIRAVKREFRALERTIRQVNRATNQLTAAVGPQKSPPGSVRD